ncbi:macrophage colony-stimulating factor 1a isoform X1 [Gadus morhua]|uniref:macrophage colony-stimulating factor 1a isoform X1 n=1 Tax=Gadus morhua TaxID=8049 RepID=UPI0011B3834D|nr:uncharacterized protein LOC115557063 isoform X1 [Gadus morhua]
MRSNTHTHTYPTSHFLPVPLCSACMSSAALGFSWPAGPFCFCTTLLTSHRPDLCANDSKSGLCYSLCAPASQMNTHNLELTAKARHLCFLLPLLMSLAWGLPGPCRHSVTKHHLLSLSRLMDNQLENGCSIVYAFTERQNLSEVCYVKAAFPHILELLNTHFNYAKNSDNRRYVSTLRRVIFNLYSQGCVPEINEEIEDSPVSFTRVLCSSPKEALQKARGVVELYAVLLRQRSSPLDWSCQEEYAALEYEEGEGEEPPATITPPATIPIPDATASGVFECQCPCPWFPKAATPSSSTAQSYSPRTQPAQDPTTAALPPGFIRHPYHTDTTMSHGTIDKDNLTPSPFKTAAFSHSQPFEERESSDVPARVIEVPYSPEAVSVRVPVLMDETDGQADKDLMYRSEASTTGPSVLSENASVSPALGLADGQRTFSSGETTTHGWAKGTMEAKDFDSQHQYDTVTQAGGSPQT